jgi:Anti-sigma-K factor rskA
VQHCTPEQLALAALREPLPEPDAAHLAGCAACQAEVASLRRSVDILAVPELAAPSGAVAPPPSVWEAIATATGVTAAPRPDAVAAGAAPSGASPVSAVPDLPAAVPAPAAPAAPPAPTAPAEATPPPGRPVSEGAPVRELRPRRSTRVLLAVAASLVVGAGLGAGVTALAQRDGGEAVTATDLAPLEGSDAEGSAEVVARGDGSVLEVQLDAPDQPDGYYEVWLIEPDIERMIPVGIVQAGTTSLDLPAGVDLAEYPIVDVSVEPLDGDPAHSGVSVARGVLPT